MWPVCNLFGISAGKIPVLKSLFTIIGEDILQQKINYFPKISFHQKKIMHNRQRPVNF
jgi:hypothetical protein